ncbi:MAG: transposase family protein [Microlunatus sp.]
MKNTTGLTRDEIQELCAMIHTEISKPQQRWPPVLGLFRSVVVALTYLRRNRCQAEIAEAQGVSQPTISRAITRVTPLIEAVLRHVVPTADDLDPATPYLVDGTLLPCWSWRGHRELFSGKHKTTGMNVQVAATLSGRVQWISDAIAGSRHDVACLDDSGVLNGMTPGQWIADKGYIGRGMITPTRKPIDGELRDTEKTFNRQVNQIRATIERVIAHFKNWWIMHTDYRRPLDTFTSTISTVTALHFWATA